MPTVRYDLCHPTEQQIPVDSLRKTGRDPSSLPIIH